MHHKYVGLATRHAFQARHQVLRLGKICAIVRIAYEVLPQNSRNLNVAREPVLVRTSSAW
jgi:hypothetical protein